MTLWCSCNCDTMHSLWVTLPVVFIVIIFCCHYYCVCFSVVFDTHGFGSRSQHHVMKCYWTVAWCTSNTDVADDFYGCALCLPLTGHCCSAKYVALNFFLCSFFLIDVCKYLGSFYCLTRKQMHRRWKAIQYRQKTTLNHSPYAIQKLSTFCKCCYRVRQKRRKIEAKIAKNTRLKIPPFQLPPVGHWWKV